MQTHREPERQEVERRREPRPSAYELLSVAFDGLSGFRLEDMLDRIEGRP